MINLSELVKDGKVHLIPQFRREMAGPLSQVPQFKQVSWLIAWETIDGKLVCRQLVDFDVAMRHAFEVAVSHAREMQWHYIDLDALMEDDDDVR